MARAMTILPPPPDDSGLERLWTKRKAPKPANTVDPVKQEAANRQYDELVTLSDRAWHEREFRRASRITSRVAAGATFDELDEELQERVQQKWKRDVATVRPGK